MEKTNDSLRIAAATMAASLISPTKAGAFLPKEGQETAYIARTYRLCLNGILLAEQEMCGEDGQENISTVKKR